LRSSRLRWRAFVSSFFLARVPEPLMDWMGPDTSIAARIAAPFRDAASVAGLILTTDAMVAELPKKEEPAPMPPGGGGMDY